MTVHMIPDRLALPVAFANTFTVDSKLTARDLSYSLTVGWLAAQREPSMDGEDIFLGDNGLRMALGRSRRDKAQVENDRVFRTSAAKATVAGIEEPVAIPSLSWQTTLSGAIMVHRKGIVRNGDRQQQWKVPAGVAASMRIKDGEPSVELPWALVQHARNRMSVIVMLRVLSMLSDTSVTDDMAQQAPRYRSADFQFSLPKLLAWLGLPADSEVKEVMRKLIEPATAEILEHTGYRVSITEDRTRYKRGRLAGREGPLNGIWFKIAYPVITTPLAYPEPRQPGTAWKPKPKYSKPPKPVVAPPAIVDNIVILPDDDDDIPIRAPNPSGPMRRPVPGSPGANFGGFAAMRGNR